MERVEPALVPQRKLSNGMVIPGIGMGTFGNDRFSPEQTAEAVYGAIKAGYRLFDCAAAYGNEKDIGKVFGQAFSKGIVQREELTIMSKVWNDMHGKGDVLVACATSLRELGLDYLDIYMVHWPFPNYHAPGAHLDGRNPDAVPFSVEEYMRTWRQMERLVDMGLVRSIGMSNMTITKLEQILPLCRIRPTVLEVEMNPTFQQPKLFEYCKAHGREAVHMFKSDEDAHFCEVYDYDLSKIEPVVVRPDFVDNFALLKDVKKEKIAIDEAFLGSCNNGRIDDLRVAAEIVKGKQVDPKVRFIVAPASKAVYIQALEEGIITTLMEAGAMVMNCNCSVCWGSCQGVIGENEVLISTGTRNFKGRAGAPSSKVYLASAATVAASALAGYITGPED